MPADSALDAAVFAAQADLLAREVLQPTALFLLGTGLGILPTRLAGGRRLPLEKIEGVPHPWRDKLLHHGHFNGLAVWLLEDAPGDAHEGDPPWLEPFPVWLAAAAGAATLVLTTAGHALPRGEAAGLTTGSIAVLADHINLSGSSPLVALGESRLGPMFPDQSLVHDRVLRRSALLLCERLGLSAREAVAACTLGPALDTPAERRWFANAGADVAVQHIAAPLLAAAHAGLGVLGLVAVTHSGDEPVDIGRIAATSSAVAPAVDDLLWNLADEVQRLVPSELERGELERGELET
jgi:purine-nucleoside phosphorylase